MRDGKRYRLAPVRTLRTEICESAWPPNTRLLAFVLLLYTPELGGEVEGPSLEELAWATGTSVTTVKTAAKPLIEAGWLERQVGGGRGRRTTYRVAAKPGEKPVQKPGEKPDGSRRVSARSQEDVREGARDNGALTSKTSSSQQVGDEAAFDAVWDALQAEGITAPSAKSPRASYAKAVRELLAIGATPDLVKRRAAAYRAHETLGGAMLTIHALSTHWDRLAAEGEAADVDAQAERWIRTSGIRLAPDDLRELLAERVERGSITEARMVELIELAQSLRQAA